jgi:3-phenylpropionate/cinnamic acid dioxygenase small subunit
MERPVRNSSAERTKGRWVPAEAAKGERSPVDEAAYTRLMAESAAARASQAPGDTVLAGDAEQFLFWEARLLDDRDYKGWISLLASNFVYWVPSEPDAADARMQSAVNFDDRRRLLDRIALIETGSLHAQTPASRTCRMISNVEAWTAENGRIEIRSNLSVWEHRRGRTAHFIGRQEHCVIKGPDHWLAERKIIRLLDCDEPQGNVTFIL